MGMQLSSRTGGFLTKERVLRNGGRLSSGAVLLVWILAGLAVPVQAEIYQFVDAAGVIHFSNVPTDPRYRVVQNQGSAVELSPQDLHNTILKASRQYRVDPNLVKAVIKVESDFDPGAVSSAGAMGLMQLMPATASTLDVENPFNPIENITGGVKHLSSLLSRFNGDLTLALAAYHAGAKRVEDYGQVPPIEKTHHYIRKVMAAYQTYRGKDLSRKTIYKVLSTNGHLIYTNIPEQYQNTLQYQVAYDQ
jgi:Transglycosylase SLT domain/Domain of unknown function (DUF4124)